MENDPNPSAPAIPDSKGKAPETRIHNSHQVWLIATELEKADRKRAKKRTRVFKAYNRFPPTEYSTLAKEGLSWQSNVNFGMMAYVIDNNLSSFFDMLTERPSMAQIKTKHGTPKEQSEWSDHISNAFTKVFEEWDQWLTNCEQDLLDMLLYGKGIEMREEDEGCCTEHVSAENILVPDGMKIDLSNFDMIVIKKKYSLHELWCKIESGASEDMGWDRKAVLDAMRWSRRAWAEKYRDHETYAKAIAEGDITPGAHLKESVDTYTLYIKEFKEKKSISRYTILRDYAPGFSLTRTAGRATEDAKGEFIKGSGFLYKQIGGIEDIFDKISVFKDCAGSGMWHQVPSLAEKVFVQCRQYDFTMNAIMDAVRINMTLMLQGNSADATERIKEMVFGPYSIIPADTPIVQQRFTLPTQEATAAVQFMMLDMFRGIGEYRVHEKGTGGEAPTATQTKLDAAEAAKLSGTQLKRYNGDHTLYYRRFYKMLVNLKTGEKDYELYEKFKDYLKDRNVPEKAWAWDSIDSIKSNMLAGAGSPSYKLMASEKTIELTNISPKDVGQRKAVEDALAALHGRENVSRYITETLPEPTFNDQKAGWENEMLSDPLANPAGIKVMPDDNHVQHVAVHLGDMERTISLVNENLDKGQVSEYVAQSAGYRLMNQGAHVMAHFDFLKRDRTKQDMLKAAMDRLNQIRGEGEKMAKKMQAVQEQKTAEFDPSKDPDLQRKLAMNQIEVAQAQRMADISAGNMAAKHQQRIDLDQDKAANQIAIERTKATEQAKNEAAKPKPATNGAV
jgi:hypothetical protein